jgi:hypothetical protein
LLRGAARVGAPVFDECEQGVADVGHRNIQSCADDAAVLIPVAGGSGGDDPGRFEESLSGWQIVQSLI